MEELSKGAHTMMLNNISLELVNIDHLSNYNSDIIQKAFQVYIKAGIYWDIVSLRLADFMMVYMTSTIQKLVDKIEGDVFIHMCRGLMGYDKHFILPVLSPKRVMLEERLEALKKQFAAIMEV